MTTPTPRADGCDHGDRYRIIGGCVACAHNRLVDEVDELKRDLAAAQKARKAAEELAAQNANLLRRCRTVLGNMAQENEGAIFNRWPINHEPLRADAKNLLPLIDAAIAGEKKRDTVGTTES